MPRVLTMTRTIVVPAERKRYLARLQSKKDYYSRQNCRFWAFEEASLPGAFLEFYEGPDRETLASAHESAPDPVVDPSRMYQEVELK